MTMLWEMMIIHETGFVMIRHSTYFRHDGEKKWCASATLDLPSTTCLADHAVSSLVRLGGGGCKMNSTDFRGDGIPVFVLLCRCCICCFCCWWWWWCSESLPLMDPPFSLVWLLSKCSAVGNEGGGFKDLSSGNDTLVMVRSPNDNVDMMMLMTVIDLLLLFLGCRWCVPSCSLYKKHSWFLCMIRWCDTIRHGRPGICSFVFVCFPSFFWRNASLPRALCANLRHESSYSRYLPSHTYLGRECQNSSCFFGWLILGVLFSCICKEKIVGERSWWMSLFYFISF